MCLPLFPRHSRASQIKESTQKGKSLYFLLAVYCKSVIVRYGRRGNPRKRMQKYKLLSKQKNFSNKKFKKNEGNKEIGNGQEKQETGKEAKIVLKRHWKTARTTREQRGQREKREDKGKKRKKATFVFHFSRLLPFEQTPNAAEYAILTSLSPLELHFYANTTTP